MNYIVLDMEWNQPYSKVKKRPHGVELSGEIIQIGAVKLDSKFNTVDTFNTKINPRFYKKINRHITDITGLTTECLSDCPDFKTAYRRFCEFCGDDCCMLTWGSDDIPMLCDNLRAHGMESTVPKWCNLQILFNAQVSHEYRQFSLSDAMEMLNIRRISDEQHDAFGDASNTARLVSRLDMSKGVDRYIGLEFMTGKNMNLPDRQGYKSVREALTDSTNLLPLCPVCDRKMQLTARKCSPSARIIEAVCKKHGDFRFRITVTKEGETYTAHKKVGALKKEIYI